jgi:hypothetical protein
MLPPHCRSGFSFTLDTPTTKNSVTVVSGTYNESLDPNFDCGGKPDVVFAMNAGIYAYESWRFVVEYLEKVSRRYARTHGLLFIVERTQP